ncbi:MAG: hypothetical protein JNM83_15690 [Myxococcales bacterium]|nr:hypothetical protein [Myxococcales bacterium]
MRRLVLVLGVLGPLGCHPSVMPSDQPVVSVHRLPQTQTQTQTPAQEPALPASPQGLAGTWDWLYRGTTQQGDLRIEEEEWHLSQQGTKLSGDYLRQVTTLSLDQRPFRCNGLLGFLVTTRVRLHGELQGDKVHLQETAVEQQKNPCSDDPLRPKTYEGTLADGKLSLRWPGGEQQLLRRPADSKLPSLTPPQGESAERLSAAELHLTGVWEWQARASGVTYGESESEEVSETEEWHLVDLGGKLAGYYDRIVERSRSKGIFACSGSSRSRSVTRYTLRGRRTGDHFFLNEQDYKAEPSPCDNGGRRIDTYRGTILPMQRLLIEWSGGQQILKRRRE